MASFVKLYMTVTAILCFVRINLVGSNSLLLYYKFIMFFIQIQLILHNNYFKI